MAAKRERKDAIRSSVPVPRQVDDVGGKFALEVQPGDVLTIETPGGGGFGAA